MIQEPANFMTKAFLEGVRVHLGPFEEKNIETLLGIIEVPEVKW